MFTHNLTQLHKPQWTEKRELFTSLTIQAFGISMVQIFLPIYVLQLGYSFQIMCALFLGQNIARLLFHLLSMKAIKRFGVKHSLSAGYFMNVVGFICVGLGSSHTVFLILGLALIAMGDNFYWNPRHVMSAQLFSKKTAGRNVSLTIILVHIAAALGPLAGGVLGDQYGINATLLVAAGVIAIASLPLFATKDLQVSNEAMLPQEGVRIPKQHNIAIAAHNFEIKSATLLWPIFIYLLANTLSTVGMIFAAGILLTVVATRIIGTLSDNGFEKRLIILGSWGATFAHITKIFIQSIGGAYAATLLYNAVSSVKSGPIAASMYKHAQDYGIYDYIKTIQLSAGYGNVLLWSTVFTASIFVEPRNALIITFVVAAAVSPLQSLLARPIIQQNIFRRLFNKYVSIH